MWHSGLNTISVFAKSLHPFEGGGIPDPSWSGLRARTDTGLQQEYDFHPTHPHMHSSFPHSLGENKRTIVPEAYVPTPTLQGFADRSVHHERPLCSFR